MTWQGIEGHDEIVARFRLALAAGRLPSSFLFVGPAGVGKRTFANKLAQALLCERHSEAELIACQQCDACVQAAALTHPDLDVVGKPADKSTIPVEVFIGDREHRMREGLCPRLARKPFRGGRKIAIVDDADLLQEEGANCLLKTLEEPPPHSVLILIGTSEQRQLPTIRSRCQTVRFAPLAEETVARLLVQKGLCDNEQTARKWATLSQGSLEQAVAVSGDGVIEVRDGLFEHLADPDAPIDATAAELSSFVDAAGKESAAKRDRLRLVMTWGQEFYRALLRELAGLAPVGDERLVELAGAARSAWSHDQEAAVLCLECCLDAHDVVERNANQKALLEWWLDELALIARTGAGTGMDSSRSA